MKVNNTLEFIDLCSNKPVLIGDEEVDWQHIKQILDGKV